jgi:hypothetical protein
MSDKDLFVGTWRLASAETFDGEGRPILTYDTGILQYTASGRMSAQLYRNDRPKFARQEWFAGSDQEIRSAFVGYIAYFGTFDLDEAARMVIHRVQGSFFPNWEGGEQRRYYRFDGNRLSLSTTPGVISDQKASATLIWERVE